MKDILWPRNPGAAGTLFPSNSFTSGLLDAEELDYEGRNDGNTINERMKWVTDPKGSGQICGEFSIKSGDSADQWGNDRSEVWPNDHDVAEGDKGWRAWSTYLPGDFVIPGGWGNCMGQVHDGGGGSPITLFGVTAYGKMIFGLRHVIEFDMGPIIRDTWLYHLQYSEHMSNYTGKVAYWMGVGVMPTGDEAPTYSKTGILTLEGGNSWDKWGIYQGSGSNRVLYKGYGRSADRETAKANAKWTTGPVPVPTVLYLGMKSVTLQWTPLAGATSYNLYRDGVKVSSAGARASTAQFSVPAGDHYLEVEAVLPNIKTRSGVQVKGY